MSQDKMPKVLKDFLQSLNREDKDDVWEWLDINPDVVQEMIGAVGKESTQSTKFTLYKNHPYSPSIRTILQK